ncbi:hypothetical protein [Microbacterium saperdae]|uniref:Uncharacterized protein n=1 Tax=Microbacterium saperdae TaxID=69368 RepID=A0A543BL80_9MICO|nr:hypothetical protein [Microbacterium saperdae]TQL85582.1 hypothetical protein FB560_1207 [Microbacterium saperdae]GGM62587.1 hypothetical protein GCM10010489_37560 [Microbacterium saperdae]
MSTLTGVWDATLQTPLGPIAIVFSFDGDPTSTASGETVPLTEVTTLPQDGTALSARWGADVTKPLPVHLDFTVTFDGDELQGTAKAGMLMPSGELRGERRTHTTS